MTKVLMVLPRYLPIIGGAEVQCSRLMHEILNNEELNADIVGVVTRRVNPDLKRREVIDGVIIERLPPVGIGLLSEYIFCLFLLFYLVINHKKYNVIHCHASSIFGMTCALVGGLLKKKVLIKVSTNGEVSAMQSSFVKRCLCKLASKFCTYITLNNQGYNEVVSNLPNARKVIIPNGIDFNLSHDSDLIESKKIRESITNTFGAEVFVCVFVGRLVQRKGINDLLQAINFIEPKMNRKKIIGLVVGDSIFQRDAENIDFSNMENIIMVGQKNNVFPYLLASDVFVSPSYVEGLPNTVLEALSCGVKCLLSDIEPHRELCDEHPLDITLFPVGDCESLCDLISKFSSNSAKFYNDGGFYINRLIQRYSMNYIASEYVAIYKE